MKQSEPVRPNAYIGRDSGGELVRDSHSILFGTCQLLLDTRHLNTPVSCKQKCQGQQSETPALGLPSAFYIGP